MSRVRLCLLVATVVVGLSATPARAERAGCTRLAAPSGSDSAPGTPASPFRTVQRLVDSLSAGETGCLRSGSYRGNVDIRSGGRASRPLRLTNYSGEKATVVGEFEVHKTAPFVVVDHLYLNGRSAGRVSQFVNAHDVTFRNNDVPTDHAGICFLLGDSNGLW